MSDVATPHSTAGMGQKFLSNRNMVLTAATLAVLVLMCGVFATLTDRFLTVSNFQNVMRNAAPVIIASCGMTTVMIARGLDLSVGSVLAASSVIAGSLAVAGVPLYLAFLLAVLFGAAVGAVNGVIIAGLAVSPIIVTLGMLNIARGAAYLISPSAILVGLPSGWSFLGTAKVLGLPMPIVIAGIVVAVFYVMTSYTTFGKRIYAIGGNEKAAALSGINAKRLTFLTFANMGMLAALAGLVFAARLNTATPKAGAGFELDVIAAVFIGGASMAGGVGTVVGAVIGAFIMGVMNNGMSILGIGIDYQQVIKGLVLLAAVIFDVMNKKKG